MISKQTKDSSIIRCLVRNYDGSIVYSDRNHTPFVLRTFFSVIEEILFSNLSLQPQFGITEPLLKSLP